MDKRSPLLDQEFLRSSLAPVDIQERRRFEELLIRYELAAQTAVEEVAADVTVIEHEDTGGCYWTKSGQHLYYMDGHVGVGVFPTEVAFEVKGSLLVEDNAANPCVEIRNWSDTNYDPMIQWSVGSDPIIKFSAGIDDSDSDCWLLCAGESLSKLTAGEVRDLARSYSTFFLVTDGGNDRITKRLRSDLSFVSKVGSHGSGDNNFNPPGGICSDGTFLYVCDKINERVVKRLVSDLSYVAEVAMPDEPWTICTDGMFIYVWILNGGAANRLINKYTCATLTYVSQFNCTIDWDNNGIVHMATDGTYIYCESQGGNTWRFAKVYCSSMTLAQRFWNNDSEPNIASMTGFDCFLRQGRFYVLAGVTNDKRIIVYEAQNFAYLSKSGNLHGAGDGQVTYPNCMDTDGTYIYIGEGNIDLAAERVQKLLLSDYSFVAKIGTYGSGDDQFNGPAGLCVVGSYGEEAYIPPNYPIFAANKDGEWVDSYPVHRFRDNIQLMEHGTIAATDYIQILAPAAITTSYDLTFPGTGPAAAGHFAVSSTGAITWGQDLGTTAGPSFNHIHLTIGTGTAPMVVTSTTKVANLNAEMTDGYHLDQNVLTTSGPSFDHLHLTVAIGTAPLVVTSTTKVDNLNADLLDGNEASAFATSGHAHALDDLSDVNAAAPNDNDFLSWDQATSRWIAVAGGGGASAFIDLTDVTEADYTGHGEQFVKVNAAENGLEFVASSVAAHALSSASHTDVDAGAPDDDDILSWDAASGKWIPIPLPAAAAHPLLGDDVHNDVVDQTVSRGSLIYGNSTPKWDELVIGAAGTVLKSDGTDVAWWLPPFIYGKRVTGRYYTSMITGYALSTGAWAADALRAQPFVVGEATTFDRIGLGITSGASAGRYMRLGVYANKANSDEAQPGALLLDSGAIEVAANQYYEVNINLTLQPGLYWLAYLPGYGFTIRVATGQTSCFAFPGAADGATAANVMFSETFAYAALPNPWPNDPATITTYSTGVANIVMRKS